MKRSRSGPLIIRVDGNEPTFTTCENGKVETMRNDSDWRDSGKWKRLYKFWLSGERLYSHLLEELIGTVRSFMFKPFTLQFSPIGRIWASWPRVYNIHTTRVAEVLAMLPREVPVLFGIDMQFNLKRDHNEVSWLSYTTSFRNGTSQNNKGLSKEQEAWSIYDCLVFLHRMEGVVCPIGGLC